MKEKREIRWEDEKSIRTVGGHHYAFTLPSVEEALSLAPKSIEIKDGLVHVCVSVRQRQTHTQMRSGMQQQRGSETDYSSYIQPLFPPPLNQCSETSH